MWIDVRELQKADAKLTCISVCPLIRIAVVFGVSFRHTEQCL